MSSSYRHTIRQEYRTVCNIQASLAVADAMLAVVNPDEIVCGKPARILTAVLERNLLPAPTDDTQEQYQLAVIRFQRWLTDIYDHDTHPEWFRPDVGGLQAPPVSSPLAIEGTVTSSTLATGLSNQSGDGASPATHAALVHSVQRNTRISGT